MAGICGTDHPWHEVSFFKGGNMKKIWSGIAKDLWIVLLDIIAVNAAYLLALLIRFVVYKFCSMKKVFEFAQYGIEINQIRTISTSIKHKFRVFFLSDRLITAP